MLDISFLELLVIAVVALVVLGPDKLPDAIRTAALWIGRAKRSFNKAKSEIEQQLNADEIRRQLHNESILSDIEEARRKADALVKDAQQELDSNRDSIKEVIDSAKDIPAITNSAQEGVPTGMDEITKEIDTEPAEIERQNASESPSGNTSESDLEDAPSAVQQPPQQPIQDFYNSPPQGRVRMEGGKYYTVDDTEPVNDSSVSDGSVSDASISDDPVSDNTVSDAPVSNDRKTPAAPKPAPDMTPTGRSSDEH